MKKRILIPTVILIGLLSISVIGLSYDYYIEPKNYIQGSHQDIKYHTGGIFTYMKVSDVDYCKVVSGSSMQPSLFEGNTVCFKEYKNRLSINAGDIINFRYDDKDVTHRINAIYPNYTLTQGDNRLSQEKIPFEDIQGVAVSILLT